MRGLVVVIGVPAVIGLGYWAYDQNIRTQASLAEVARLERAIVAEREDLAILRAEWAFLNRPDRLRDLVALNFERLRLLPMAPEQFGDVNQIAYPPEALPTTQTPRDAQYIASGPAAGARP